MKYMVKYAWIEGVRATQGAIDRRPEIISRLAVDC